MYELPNLALALPHSPERTLMDIYAQKIRSITLLTSVLFAHVSFVHFLGNLSWTLWRTSKLLLRPGAAQIASFSLCLSLVPNWLLRGNGVERKTLVLQWGQGLILFYHARRKHTQRDRCLCSFWKKSPRALCAPILTFWHTQILTPVQPCDNY